MGIGIFLYLLSITKFVGHSKMRLTVLPKHQKEPIVFTFISIFIIVFFMYFMKSFYKYKIDSSETFSMKKW